MKKVIIHFKDNGQDVLKFTCEFYPDYGLGYVKDSDMQGSVWKDMCILSGKPKKGGFLTISKSPTDDVIEFKHEIVKVEIQKAQRIEA